MGRQLENYNYKEAQIHGEICLADHVQRLVASERHSDPDAEYGEERVKALCAKHGWELVWESHERRRRIKEERQGLNQAKHHTAKLMHLSTVMEMDVPGEVLDALEPLSPKEVSQAGRCA